MSDQRLDTNEVQVNNLRLHRVTLNSGNLHSNFFAIDNFATVKDEVLYEQLLEEFKDWLEQAKIAGIL